MSNTFFSKITNVTVLTEKRIYILEVCLISIAGIIIINALAPKSNALYYLLLIPGTFLFVFFGYLIVQIFKKPEIGIPVIAGLLPFERIGALTTNSFNIRLSQVFIIVILIAYIFLGIKSKWEEIKIKKDFSFYLLIVFALVNIASLSIAVNKSRSLDVLAFDLFIFFVYILISNLLINKEILRKTILVLLWISVGVCIFGIYQFMADMLNFPLSLSGLIEGYSRAGGFNFPRVIATETEPQFWGNFLLIPISISGAIILGKFQEVRNTLQKGKLSNGLFLLSLICFILSIINLLMTFSRGAWYASIVGIAIIIFFHIRKFLNIKIIITAIIVIFVALGSFIFVLQYVNAPLTLQSFISRATQIQDMDRTKTEDDALHFFSSHEILGIGVGSFGPYESANPYAKPQVFGQDIGWRIVNNEYIEILTETGIIGIISFALFILYVIYQSFFAFSKVKNTYTKTILLGCFAAFISMLVQYYGFSTLYVMQIWVLFAFLDAISWNILYLDWDT